MIQSPRFQTPSITTEQGLFTPASDKFLLILNAASARYKRQPPRALNAIKPHLTGAVDDPSQAVRLLEELSMCLAAVAPSDAAFLRGMCEWPTAMLKGVLRLSGARWDDRVAAYSSMPASRSTLWLS